jgi:protein involved in polysaccharide export with SLBB domain
MRTTAALVVFASAISLLGTAAQREVVSQDANPTVHATGDVLYPGDYPLTSGLTALDLLTSAGGSPKDTVHSLIVRYKGPGEPEDVPFNPKERMRPGDVLIVRGVYAVRPDEVLQIDVAGHPEISGRYIVQDDGTVILPASARPNVRDDPQFARHVSELLSSKLSGTPRVDVSIAGPRGPRVTR